MIGLAVVAVVTGGGGFLYVWVNCGHTFREAVEILWRFVMIAGIIAGGAWALYQWFKHRASKPAISITDLNVESQIIGKNELYVLVDVTFKNPSKVVIDIGNRGCYLRKISPLKSKDIKRAKCEFICDNSKRLTLPWVDDTYGIIERNSEKDRDILEPDEEIHEFFEFIVSRKNLYTLAAYFYINYRGDKPLRCDHYKLHSVTEANLDGR